MSTAPGATVAWAFRGFNPHDRKDRSYYPLLAHVGQTGHILRVKNRPGNVHDSKQAVAFLGPVQRVPVVGTLLALGARSRQVTKVCPWRCRAAMPVTVSPAEWPRVGRSAWRWA